MQKMSYDKEREFAAHILNKYIRKHLTTLLRKGYSSWLFNFNDGQIKRPVRQLTGFNQAAYTVYDNSSTEALSYVVIAEDDRERFINVAHYPDLFSKLARPVLDDLESIVQSAPSITILTDPVNHENTRRSVSTIMKALLLNSENRFVPLLFLQAKLNWNLKTDYKIKFGHIKMPYPLMPYPHSITASAVKDTDTYKTLEQILDKLQDKNLPVYEILEQIHKTAPPKSWINERHIHGTILAALPFLRENEILVQLVEAPGALERITHADEKPLQTKWARLLAGEFKNIQQRLGDISEFTKEKQLAVVEAIFQSKFDIPARVTDSFSLHVVNSRDLSGCTPEIITARRPKLFDWSFLRDYLAAFLLSVRSGFLGSLNHRGSIMITPGTEATAAFFPDVSCSIEVEDLRYSACSPSGFPRDNNLYVFSKMKQAILIDILREQAANGVSRLTQDERDKIMDELDARFEKASEELLTNILDTLMNDLVKTVRQVKVEKKKAPVKTNEDVLFSSITKISRIFLKETRRLGREALNVNYGKSEHVFPVVVGGVHRGEIKFSLSFPNLSSWSQTVSVREASLEIDGYTYPVGPIYDLYNGRTSGVEIARLMSRELEMAAKDPAWNGHPLLYADESEVNALIGGIKTGFDRLYEQEMIKMNQGKDQFYDTFRQEFPEELFEWATLRPMG